MSARNASDGTQVERASDRELVITRVFRARPQTVFGGTYRYVFGKAGEPRMAFSGVYQEVVAGARVVYTNIFEPMREAGEGLITVTYEPHAEGCFYTQRELFPSKQVLEGVIASGMEKGMRETLDTLAELVTAL